MSFNETVGYRLAADMIEAASQALAAAPDDCCIGGTAFDLIDDARRMVRDMIEYIDSEHARLNAKPAPSKEAL